MSADNEKLFTVVQRRVASTYSEVRVIKTWVFRTRAAARKFVGDSVARSTSRGKYEFRILAATWGPEQ